MANENDGSSVGSAFAIIAVLAGAVLAGFGIFVGMGELFDGGEVATWVKVVSGIGVGALILAGLMVIGHRMREARLENLGDVEL